MSTNRRRVAFTTHTSRTEIFGQAVAARRWAIGPIHRTASSRVWSHLRGFARAPIKPVNGSASGDDVKHRWRRRRWQRRRWQRLQITPMPKRLRSDASCARNSRISIMFSCSFSNLIKCHALKWIDVICSIEYEIHSQRRFMCLFRCGVAARARASHDDIFKCGRIAICSFSRRASVRSELVQSNLFNESNECVISAAAAYSLRSVFFFFSLFSRSFILLLFRSFSF